MAKKKNKIKMEPAVAGAVERKGTEYPVYDVTETYSDGETNLILIDAMINTEFMKLNARIDKIILAHESCKTLKGL